MSGQRPTAEQAEGLWRRWVEVRDVKARDRLVLSYSPMVKYLASRKIRELPAHCELEDLISCGLLALIAAVDRFDPKKGATFEQYAWTRVSGAIMDELRRQDWASRSVRRTGREIERARDAWLSKNGRAPSESELAGELSMTVVELRDRLEEIDRADLLSLNAPARGTDDALSVEVGDTLEAPIGTYDPELSTLAGERAEAVRAAIASLSEREQTILTLLHVHHMQGAEIGRHLGVSESRVSQILASIRRKLKDAIDDYDKIDARVA
ncbi:MAG: FliA/WhiG family RNA polymerase sigma factor [Thermoleophilia bacterium]